MFILTATVFVWMLELQTTTDTHYNLEMQVKNPVSRATGEFQLPKRTRYYQAMLGYRYAAKRSGL